MHWCPSGTISDERSCQALGRWLWQRYRSHNLCTCSIVIFFLPFRLYSALECKIPNPFVLTVYGEINVHGCNTSATLVPVRSCILSRVSPSVTVKNHRQDAFLCLIFLRCAQSAKGIRYDVLVESSHVREQIKCRLWISKIEPKRRS